MNINITIRNDYDSILLSQKIRREVFVEEQDIPLELDLDGKDANSYHSLAYNDNLLVGVARLTLHKDKVGILARVAIKKSYRGKGIATKLVESLVATAKQLSLKAIDIHAHEYLKQYYEAFGFNYIKAVEKVGNHQLIEMRLSLP